MVLFFSCTAFAEFSVPSDLNVQKPDASVPQECARFFEEKGWGQGSWGNYLPHQLWVEKVNSDCTAQVVYMWGRSSNGNVPPGYTRTTGTIQGSTLSLSLRETTKATYTIENGDSELHGVYVRKEYNNEVTSKTILKRGAQ